VNQNRVRASKELVSHLIMINTEYLCRHKCSARILYRVDPLQRFAWQQHRRWKLLQM